MKSTTYIFLLCFLFALAIKAVVSNPLEHVKRDDDMSNPKIECNIHNDSPMVSDFGAAKTSLEAPGRVCEQTKCLNYFNPYCTYDANNKECTRIAEHNSLLIEICGKYKLVAQCRSAVSAAQELKAKCKGSFGGVERFGGTARYKWGYIKVRKV